MKQSDIPVDYNTYIYLTQTGPRGDKPKYALHILLWMPENYEYHGQDTVAPEDEPPPVPPALDEVNHYRIILLDNSADDDDSEKFKPIALTIEIDAQPKDKNVVQVFYVVKNEKPGNVKITKKPKAKMAYAHADIGGSGPGPQPPGSIETATLI